MFFCECICFVTIAAGNGDKFTAAGFSKGWDEGFFCNACRADDAPANFIRHGYVSFCIRCDFGSNGCKHTSIEIR